MGITIAKKKTDLLSEIQKSIYAHMKEKAFSLEVDASKELISYQKSQQKISKRNFTYSSIQELIKNVIKSRVIYLGDFHSLDQNSRNFERISKALLKDKKSFSIAVEFIAHKDQKIIDHYLKGAITEIEMLEEINYHESWKFPWRHYKPFFDIAKKNGLQVIALNSEGTLPQRDRFAAKILAERMKEEPNERILVFFGELHILPDKLPKLVKKIFQKDFLHTIIHQNLDDIYFKVFETSTQHQVDKIIQFTEDEFVLLTSPPWIKYESMIYWYENLIEDPEFDIHHYIMNTSLMPLSSDVPDNFCFLTEKIAHALNLDIETNTLEDFNLYDHTKLSMITSYVEKLPSPALVNLYKRLIRRSESFKLPFSSVFYCSSYSINRISFLAGLHLQSLLIKQNCSGYESFLVNQKPGEVFIHFTKQFICGYLSSKIINPQRKCDLYQDLKIMHKQKPDDHVLKFCMTFFTWNIEKRELEKILFRLQHQKDIFKASKILGFYLGDRLYEATLATNKPLPKRISNFLYSHSLDSKKFHQMFKKIIPEKSYLKHKKRYF